MKDGTAPDLWSRVEGTVLPNLDSLLVGECGAPKGDCGCDRITGSLEDPSRENFCFHCSVDVSCSVKIRSGGVFGMNRADWAIGFLVSFRGRLEFGFFTGKASEDGHEGRRLLLLRSLGDGWGSRL